MDRSAIKLGNDIPIYTRIEKAPADCSGAITNVKIELDNKIKAIIDSIFKSVFELHKELINEVYKTKGDNDLHYCIILREDTFENRNKIFEILNFYDGLEFSYCFPVDFQFVPTELSSKIEYKLRHGNSHVGR